MKGCFCLVRHSVVALNPECSTQSTRNRKVKNSDDIYDNRTNSMVPKNVEIMAHLKLNQNGFKKFN